MYIIVGGKLKLNYNYSLLWNNGMGPCRYGEQIVDPTTLSL